MDCVLSIDLGGTYIKYACVRCDGALVGDVKQIPAKSWESAENIFDKLSFIINSLASIADKNNLKIKSIGISTPGPFDYKKGCSYMVGKYDSIYGIDLRFEIRKRISIESVSICFVQDAAAYLLGEHYLGAASGYENCACVTLGTGVGYACMLDGKLLLNEKCGPYYVFALQEYAGEKIENLISGAGIVKRYNSIGGNASSAKEVFELAENGDIDAISIFVETGKILGEALSAIPEIKKTNCLIVGGQISLSFSLMEESSKNALKDLPDLELICAAKFPQEAALIGVGCNQNL